MKHRKNFFLHWPWSFANGSSDYTTWRLASLMSTDWVALFSRRTFKLTADGLNKVHGCVATFCTLRVFDLKAEKEHWCGWQYLVVYVKTLTFSTDQRQCASFSKKVVILFLLFKRAISAPNLLIDSQHFKRHIRRIHLPHSMHSHISSPQPRS